MLGVTDTYILQNWEERDVKQFKAMETDMGRQAIFVSSNSVM